MIRIEVDTEDLKEIKKQFNRLSISVQDKILRDVIAKHAKPVMKKMKEIAPVSEKDFEGGNRPSHPKGYLRASIGIIRSRKGKYPTVWVRPRFKGKWDPWYQHFPMAGTRRYKVAPNPFVDRTWAIMRTQVTTGIKRDTSRMIQDRINRL